MKKHELMNILPAEELNRIFSYEYHEYECDFLGFTDVYKGLSSFIEKSYSVIDFGCYLAPQAYYFRNHKEYIGVDNSAPIKYRYHQKNVVHYDMPIQHFIQNNLNRINLDNTFAISSYVPDENANELIRKTFKRCCIYYCPLELTPFVKIKSIKPKAKTP